MLITTIGKITHSVETAKGASMPTGPPLSPGAPQFVLLH